MFRNVCLIKSNKTQVTNERNGSSAQVAFRKCLRLSFSIRLSLTVSSSHHLRKRESERVAAECSAMHLGTRRTGYACDESPELLPRGGEREKEGEVDAESEQLREDEHVGLVFRAREDEGEERVARVRARRKEEERERTMAEALFCSLLIPRHSFARSNLPARRQFNLQPNTLLCLT